MNGLPLKVLIVGGYGTFGGRLARFLASEPRLHLFIGGRSLQRATAFVQALSGPARKTPLAFDRDANIDALLAECGPDIVVDASGPFQAYGARCFRVIEACVRLGINYIDLADSPDFVAGVSQFDAKARDRGIFVICGASTCPAISGAVLRELARDLVEVRSIAGGIAPSPRANVGLSVIRAIASYAGQPVAVRDKGQESVAYPLTRTRRMTIAPPGYLPLCSRRFSLVNVPDLHVFRDLHPEACEIFFGAAPAPALLHRCLNGLAWLVRLHLFPTLLPLAEVFHFAHRFLRWGEHRGGMFVKLKGRRTDGSYVERSWHLIAEGDDGPSIPAVPAAALVRRCLQDMPPALGARSAVGTLELSDLAQFFSTLRITTGRREFLPAAREQPLFKRLLGDAWERLPAGLREAHDVHGRVELRGMADVDRGRGLFARCLANLMRLPAAGTRIPVTVVFERKGDSEIWHRRFGDGLFHSVLSPGEGRSEFLLCEQFGAIAVLIALVIDGDRLRFVIRDWSFGGVPLPRCLAPAGEAYEDERDGVFHFSVEMMHSWLGLIVRYRGFLTPAREHASTELDAGMVKPQTAASGSP
jgi:hypothetical protein